MKAAWNYFFTSVLLYSGTLPQTAVNAQRFLQDGNAAEGCCACDAEQNNLTDEDATTIRILVVGKENFAAQAQMVRDDAEAFMAIDKRVIIEVEEVGSIAEINEEIRSQAVLDTGFYDGFLSNPGVVGTAVATDPPGFMDLGDFVRESSDLDWTDILPAFREVVTQYDGKVYMLPLDGDVHSLFYRIDVLNEFGLEVPRTWDEYVAVAKATHGKTYKGTTLNGSCIGRVLSCVGSYYANLVLAPITQTMGTTTGHLFDSKNMRPLAGEALAEAIRQLELQNKYGADDEFEGCGGGGSDAINIRHQLTEGDCVLSYNWGDNYKKHLSEMSKVGGLLGVAPTPGSQRVLDRNSGKLVPCDEKLCKFGTYYDDIGWVNRAPYAAFGGWAVSVASNVSPVRQRLAADFFAYASGKRSILGVVPNATAPLDQMNGQDPFRKSHLDIDLWVEQGYPREGAETYKNTILESLSSQNLAVDIRFPQSDKINAALDQGIYDYLQRVKNGEIPESNRAAERLAVADSISSQWESIIDKFDNDRAAGFQSILVQYQRSLGIYKDNNYIGNMRYFSWTLASLVVVASFVMIAWVAKNRKTRIVRASQPIFLIIICLGCLLMGAGIYPLSIDDQTTSQGGASIACMSIPWLLGMGFSCSFSALFSKTLRVNKLFSAATSFQRVTVSVKDVMLPFIAQTTLNIILLSIWTGVNPMVFTRIETSPVSSYGVCTLTHSTGGALTPIILFGMLNLGTLIAANVQAFRARGISDEFSESKYIAIALLSILQAMLIGVPVAFMTQKDPPVYAVVVSSFVFIVAMSLLLLMFVPKMLLAKKKERENKLKRQKSSYNSGTRSTESAEGMRMIRGPTSRFRAEDVKFSVEESSKMEAEDDEAMKQKLKDLKMKLTEQGIDAKALFSEVGLVVSEVSIIDEADEQNSGEEED